VNVELRYVIILRGCLQGSYERCVVVTVFFTTIPDCSLFPLYYVDESERMTQLFMTNDWTMMIADFTLELCR
jgi:hypothetical protein